MSLSRDISAQSTFLSQAILGPQSPEQTQAVLQRLNRKVSIVRLFRYDTLRYGLPE